MNNRSIKIIEEAISKGKWTWLEFDNNSNSIYLEFINLRLSSNPILNKYSYKGELAIRFGQNIYFSIFYNDCDDLKFLNLDNDLFNKIFLSDELLTDFYSYFYKEFSLDVVDFKFNDFDFLNKIKNDFSKTNILINNCKRDYSINSNNSNSTIDSAVSCSDSAVSCCDSANSSSDSTSSSIGSFSDFLLCFRCENIAIVVGGNFVNCFNDFETLNDDDIKRLSNNWYLYFLNYWNKKGTDEELEFDLLCEEFPLK